MSEASRLLCVRLKSADVNWLPTYAGKTREQVLRDAAWACTFNREVVLVPIPGSTSAPRGVWPAERLAVSLCGIGLGRSVWPAIRRCVAVRKSATALNADRPSVQQHYESFSVLKELRPPERMVLVDDVITKGRTIFAAACRLYDSFPNADIQAFALVRTMGLLPRVAHFLEPCHGVVKWGGGDARREP